MAVGYIGVSNAAAQAAGTTTTAGTASVTPTLPTGSVSGNRIYVFQSASNTAGTTPTSWTALYKDVVIGSGTVAAGAGLRYASCYYRDYDGAWTMPAFTLTSAQQNSQSVGAVALSKAAGETWDTPTYTAPALYFGTAGTAYSVTSPSFAWVTGAFTFGHTTLNDNVTSGTPGGGASGVTVGTRTERIDGGTATGNDARLVVGTASITTGGTGTITRTSTLSAASQGGTIWVQQTVTAPVYPKVNTFTDAFATADSGKWTIGAAASVANNQLVLTPNTGYTGNLYSVNSYDLTGSSCTIELVQPPNVGNGQTQAMFRLMETGVSNEIGFLWQNGNLISRRGVDGVTTVNTAVYSATNHRWLRISEAAGVVTWATSPDGSNWTTFGPTWTVSGFPTTGVSVQPASGYYGTEPSPGTVIFDNLNVAPATTITGSITGSGALTASLAPSLSRTAALTGSGALTASLTPALSRAAAISGSGVLSATVPAVAKTYYVAGSGGSDSNNGETSGAAWATITKVNATTFNPGDTILFQRGATFNNAALVCDNSGTSGSRVTFGAYGSGARPILDGGAGTTPPVTVTGNWVTLQDLHVRNAGPTVTSQRGIAWVGTDGLCQRVYSTGNTTGLQADNGAHRLRVTDSEFSYNQTVFIGSGGDDDYGAMGISLQQVDDVEVDHCVFTGNYGASTDYDFDGAAIEVYGAVRAVLHHNISTDCPTFSELGHTRTDDITFHHNLIINTAASPAVDTTAFNAQGTGTYGPVTNIKIYHNTAVIRGGNPQGIVLGAGVTASVHNNIIESSYAGWFAGEKKDEGHNVWLGTTTDVWSSANAGTGIASTSVNANPQFVSTTDFHLLSNSPAINRGVDLGYTTDYDGNPRVSGSLPDAGAFERVTTGPQNNPVTYQANGATVFGTVDAAVTAATSLIEGPGATMLDPWTGGAQYEPNKVWSIQGKTVASTTAAEAVTNGQYVQWNISRTGGMLPKQVRIKGARGAGTTTIRGFRVRWSVDNYATDLLGRDFLGDGTELRPLLKQFPSAGDTFTGDLSGAPQQTSISFRIYEYAPAVANTCEFDDLEYTYSAPGGGSELSVSLTGSSSLTVSTAPSLSRAAALTGSSSLTVSTAPSLSSAAALTGSSSLIVSTAPSLSSAAALTGSSSLTVSVALDRNVSLTGSSSLTASVTPSLSRAAALTGSSSLTAVLSDFRTTVSASISGTSSLTATASGGGQVSAALTGSSSLSATVSPALALATTVTGSGALSAILTPSLTRTAAITGTSNLTVAVTAVSTSAALTGSSAISASLTPSLTRTATLTGASTLAAAVTGVATSATLTGSGQLSATVTNPRTSVSVSLTGTSSLTASTVGQGQVAANLTGSSSLTATRSIALTRSAVISSSGTLSAALAPSLARTAAITGTAQLVVNLQPSLTRTAAITGSGQLTADTSVMPIRHATLSGSSQLTATTSPHVLTNVTIIGSSEISATRTVSLARSAAIAGSAQLLAVLYVTSAVEGAITGTGTLTVKIHGEYRDITVTWGELTARSVHGSLTSRSLSGTLDARTIEGQVS